MYDDSREKTFFTGLSFELGRRIEKKLSVGNNGWKDILS